MMQKDNKDDFANPSAADTDSGVGEITAVRNESGFHRTFTPRQIHVCFLAIFLSPI